MRKEIGVTVKTGVFEDAEHVKLFLKYPVRYVQYVYDFMYNYCNITQMPASERIRSHNSVTATNSTGQYTQQTSLS